MTPIDYYFNVYILTEKLEDLRKEYKNNILFLFKP